MKILNRIYLVLAIIFGIAGFVQCIRWGNEGTVTIGYLLNFLPATAFLIAYAAGQNIPRKVTHALAILLCLMTLVVWSFCTLAVEWLIDATTPITNVERYEEILGEHWHEKELVNHFPNHIPPDAKNVRFSFFPGFMQGGADIQLGYSISAKAIDELYDQFSQMKTKSFIGGDKNYHKFPDDFEIMIFDKGLKEEDRTERHNSNHGKNHGKCHGVAISKTRNEIVYWAESW